MCLMRKCKNETIHNASKQLERLVLPLPPGCLETKKVVENFNRKTKQQNNNKPKTKQPTNQQANKTKQKTNKQENYVVLKPFRPFQDLLFSCLKNKEKVFSKVKTQCQSVSPPVLFNTQWGSSKSTHFTNFLTENCWHQSLQPPNPVTTPSIGDKDLHICCHGNLYTFLAPTFTCL